MATQAKDLLPLGSIVILNGAVKKLMIVQRAMQMKPEAGGKYFDYGGCLYPEGMLDSRLAYFSTADIYEVVAKGYTDEDDAVYLGQLADSLAKPLAEQPPTVPEPVAGDNPFLTGEVGEQS